MKYPRTWEKISKTTYRLKVPNGWIVSQFTMDTDTWDDRPKSNAICFVPDELHKWEIKPNCKTLKGREK